MSSENETRVEKVPESNGLAGAAGSASGERFVEELVARAQTEGLQLSGEAGLLQQLTKRVLESALDGEMADHLGYDKHDPAGKNGANSRNGNRAKTVLTDVGPVDVAVPRDRDGSFEPQMVKKRQRRPRTRRLAVLPTVGRVPSQCRSRYAARPAAPWEATTPVRCSTPAVDAGRRG